MRENINLVTEYIKDSRQLNALIKWSDFMEGFNTKSSTKLFMIMLKVTVEHMQGNGGGNHCLKVILDDGTRFGKTLGFIVPIQYNLEGYWGGTTYLTFSFNENKVGPTEQSFNTLWDVAKHLGVDCDELCDAIPRKEGKSYLYQWEYMNTDYARNLWWK